MVGIGYEKVILDSRPTMDLELRSSPFWQPSLFGIEIPTRWGGAFQINSDNDLWAGLGFTGETALPAEFRAEVALFFGAYSQGDGTDLGGTFPMFRTKLGVSRAVSGPWRVGASVSHKSNAGTDSRNPGSESFLLQVYRAF